MEKLILCSILFSAILGSGNLALAEEIRIEPLRTEKQINEFYCKITTGTPEDLRRRPCVTPNPFPLDVIYVPTNIGERILSHIHSAWQKKFFTNVSQSDFFHGHPITKGPQVVYEGSQSYFEDLVGLLYHSEEYTDRWRYDEGKPKTPRSFVGTMDMAEVIPAIDLMLPGVPLGNYLDSGTLYIEQLLKSQVDWSNHTGKERIFLNTGEKERPCEVLNSIHFFHDSNGRFRLKSGETIELILTCKYY